MSQEKPLPVVGTRDGSYEGMADQMILRDHLAVQRTHLANERTLLAYLRTGIAMAIAGVTIVHFGVEPWFRIFGLLCVPAGVVVCTIGIGRFRQIRGRIRRQ